MDYGKHQIFGQGALSNPYLNVTGGFGILLCFMSYRDPTDDIIADIREMVYPTAELNSVACRIDHLWSADIHIMRNLVRQAS